MEFIHFLYILMILFALFSVFAKNLKRAIIGSSVFGLWASVAYMLYHAPDVAIAEAIISSALATILYIITIKNYDDISTKLPKLNLKILISTGVTVGAGVLALYLTIYSTPFTNSKLGMLVIESFFSFDSVVNPVTGVVLNYRVFDTIFEALLLLIASVGVVHLVRCAKIMKKSKVYEDDPWHEEPDFGVFNKFAYYKNEQGKYVSYNENENIQSITMRHKRHPSAVMTITFIMPILVLISIYLIISEPIAPGGGFQGGALLAATFVSHYLIMPDHPVSIKFLNSVEKILFLLLVSVMSGYILLGLITVFPQIYAYYFILTDALLGVKVFCGLSIMFLSFAREHNSV